MKTDRDIFEIMANHLLNQKEKSMTKGETCAYRGYTLGQISEVAYSFVGEEAYYDDYGFQQALSNKYGKPTMMCAVGALIKDEFYDSDFENNLYSIHPIMDAIRKSNPDWEIKESGMKLLDRFQGIHDNVEIKDWSDCIEKASNEFDSEGNFSTIPKVAEIF